MHIINFTFKVHNRKTFSFAKEKTKFIIIVEQEGEGSHTNLKCNVFDNHIE